MSNYLFCGVWRDARERCIDHIVNCNRSTENSSTSFVNFNRLSVS